MRRSALSLLAFLLVGYLANRVKLAEGIHAHDARQAIYDAARVAAATVGFFAVCGFGLVRLTLPDAWRRHELLWVLPVGACAGALELTALGFAFVPFPVSLGLVIAANLVLAAYALRRRGPPPLPRPLGSTLWPLLIAALVAAFVLIPLWRAGYTTVIGENSDAHLATGTAQFLQHDYPLAVDPAQPVNRVPIRWRSKQPIYYALAAVSSLSGLATWGAISAMLAVMLAISLLGFFLLARELLGSNLLGACAAMALAGLDQMVVHTVIHPFYNQTWGFMTLAPALLLAWWVVSAREHRRGPAALLGLFLVTGAFAYPLALPIPVVGLVAFYLLSRWSRRRAGEDVPGLLAQIPLPTGRRARIVTIVIGLLLAVPVVGALEKLISGSLVILNPFASLTSWGGDVTTYIPRREFLSIGSDQAMRIAVPLMIVAFVLALRRLDRPAAGGLVAVAAVGALGSVWLHHRVQGPYLDFKLLAFVGPVVVVIVAVGASRVPVVGWIALAAFGLSAYDGAHAEVAMTANELPPTVTAVARITKLLGPGQSVRLDMDPPLQIWVAYFLAGEPICSQRPLDDPSSPYPHPPVSRKARYILTDQFMTRPFDAVGPPVGRFGQFTLYRENPAVGGVDRCSQRRVEVVNSVPLI